MTAGAPVDDVAEPARLLPCRIRLTQFDDCHERTSHLQAVPSASAARLQVAFAGATWTIGVTLSAVANRPDAVDGRVVFRVIEGEARSVAAALEWPVASWSHDTFVMLPAAVYNGNRYPCRPYRYPPIVHAPEDIGLAAPILVTDVPRLSHEAGTSSRLQLLTGDVATPCLSFHDPRAGRAVILLTEQGSAVGNHGLTVEESPDRGRAVLRIEAPGVRRETLYTMATTATPSWDRGADWAVGTEAILRFRLFVFAAREVQALYDRFAEVRKDLTGPVTLRHTMPFSAAWRLVEEKYQRDNWCEAGYYRVGTHEAAAQSRYQDWQAGWIGGGMAPFPFLLAGRPESRQRAVRNLGWMFARAQHPSGLFHSGQYRGVPFGDGFDAPGTATWHMVRRQADVLYFLVNAFHVLRARHARWTLPAPWEAGTRRLADRLADTFRRFGQLGQYLDAETGDVVVGGSTAAAMAPGALALAGQYFGVAEYGRVAEALAAALDERDVRSGLTVGGPGEILKGADSESAFALLESLVVLYETSGEAWWLARAEAIAAQCLTWCTSYDYVFPPDSWLGRLGVGAAGSVWANVQNKHAAPGICTLSGDALFKLFRYTGRMLYLEQIRETAHNLTQYLARADRPVGDPRVMRPGWMCERVNLSDWEGRENVGGSLFGSCWPEVSLLLTAVELPGLYAQTDTGLLAVFDHIEAQVEHADGAAVVLHCANPTAFDAEVRVFAERASSAPRILGQAAGLGWPTIVLSAGEARRITVKASLKEA